MLLPLQFKENKNLPLLTISAQHSLDTHGNSIIPHLEINIHPLDLYLTYQSIMFLANFFYYDQKRLFKKYHKYKSKFLPTTQVLTEYFDVVQKHPASSQDQYQEKVQKKKKKKKKKKYFKIK